MVVSLNNQSVEQMGVFGFSWPEKVAAFMLKHLTGVSAKKLKDFFQAGGKNVSLVNNMHREYIALMATGRQPATFTVSPDAQGKGGEFSQDTVSLATAIAERTNVDTVIVLEFLRALFVLSRDGKIPFAKWNPAGYKQSTELKKTFKTETGVFDVMQKTGSYAKIALWLGGIGVAAYLLSQIKGLRG